MEITLNNETYEVKFGARFINSMDNKMFVTREEMPNIKFGTALEIMVPKLKSYDTNALIELLYEGTRHLKKAPKREDFFDFIDEHEDIDALYDEVLEELKNGNATKKKVRALLEELENVETVE